ncbi:diaminopropionate ammonia-lyase [Paracoccus onubensis]|uniref:diaminopropionate ammonia-lyase n=1 Tax=Paracoccus onubensis TaxID=1675788 RepID=UPI00272EF71C|nr:diaminopropionate ammonia-lyase [Paracoccus onubensis]MDP0930309.1 diaminopropionate ammonia-lyase [Paracoccus onubensis]
MQILPQSPTELAVNAARSQAPYNAERRTEILSLARLENTTREIATWSGYEPTPLHNLSDLAEKVGVSTVCYKDEGSRFGLGSFKALGGAYAVFRLLQGLIAEKTGEMPSSQDLIEGRYVDHTRKVVVACATDGNHGRSVAWGAKLFRCACTIYVHEHVSVARRAAIGSLGATVVVVPGNYDDAVRQVASDAAALGWHIVSDTSYEGYQDVPRDVMQGYGLMVQEAATQLGSVPTHVFVQGGVGGVAASVCAFFWETFEKERPRLVVVEPKTADCLFQSASAGTLATARGDLDTIMAGLACGEPSILAWRILQPGADAFMTIVDDAAANTMRLLANPGGDDPKIMAGESAVAGLAGFILAAQQPELRVSLGLTAESRILVFGTEGATDPEAYQRIVTDHEGVAPRISA